MQNELVSQHLGIIVRVASRHWFLLPPSVRTYYDIDDLISEVVINIVRSGSRYDSKRAAHSSTFVYHVANNCCRSVLSHHLARKRGATATAIPIDSLQIPAISDSARLLESRQAVEGFLCGVVRQASPQLRGFLEALLTPGVSLKKPSPLVQEELRFFARRYRVSCSDLLLARRCLVGC